MESLWGPLIIGVLFFLWGYGDLIAGSHKTAARARDQLHKERMMATAKIWLFRARHLLAQCLDRKGVRS